MAHAFQTSHRPARQTTPWRRARVRRWRRPNDLPSATVLFSAIPSLPRCMLSRLTTRMIDRMDEIDGDLDVELNGDERDDDGDRRDVSYSEWHARSPQHHAADHEVGRGEIVDGNDDHEPDEDVDDAHDDGCGPVYNHGRRVSGARDDDPGNLKPVYGANQTGAAIGTEPVASLRRTAQHLQEQAYE